LPIRPIQPLTSQAAPIRDPNSSSFYIPSSVVDRNQDNASSDRQIRLLLSFTRSDNIIILNIIYLNFLTFDMKASNKCFQWIGFFFSSNPIRCNVSGIPPFKKFPETHRHCVISRTKYHDFTFHNSENQKQDSSFRRTLWRKQNLWQ